MLRNTTLDDEDEELYADYDDAPPEVEPHVAEKAIAEWNKFRALITTKGNEDGSQRTVIKATRSAYVRNLIFLDGEKFDFTGRQYLQPIYDRNDQDVLLKTARQVEKSTYLSNNLVVTSIVLNYNKCLYVSPSHTQTRQFSSEKLKPILERSPLIRTYFQDSAVSSQVFEKGFTNGSFIFLRSAFRTADRARGISARILCVSGEGELTVEGKGLIKVKDFCGSSGAVGSRILTFNERTHSFEYDTVEKIYDSGIKPTVELITEYGQSIRTTEDHRILTWAGWKEARDLSLSDWVLLSPEPLLGKTPHRGEAHWYFIGSLMGDGSHHDRNVYVRTTDEAEAELLAECAGFDNATTARYERKSSFTGRDLTEYWIRVRERSSLMDDLVSYGILGQCTHNKRVTFMHKMLTISERAAFLAGLIVTDGCVSVYDSKKDSATTVAVNIVSTSEHLIRDCQHILLSLGVLSYFSFRKPSNGISKKMQYIVTVRDNNSTKKLMELCGHLLGRKQISLSLPDGKRPLTPVSHKQAIGILKESGVQIKGCGVDLRNKDTLLPLKSVEKLGAILPDNLELNRATLPWVRIRSLNKSSPENTYDLTLRKNHNFSLSSVITHNCLDELQDMLLDQIPVIKECTSHYPDSVTLQAGTPKSFNNPIEVTWKTTSQNEWLVPCSHCRKWNFLDERNIAPTKLYVEDKLPPGPVCKYCEKPIHVPSGQWVSMNKASPIMGYRIPQLMVPWICGLKAQWLKLLWKRDNYPISQFANEVLGLSYDSASNPITQEELVDICSDDPMWDLDRLTSDQVNIGRGQLLTAGVDWGEGIDGSEKSPTGKLRNASYTVLTVGYYHTPTQYKVLAVKKFTGREVDPEYTVKYIAQVCRLLGIQLVGVDWGHGWGVNNSLIRILGAQHVVMFQYLPKLKERMKWDPIGFRYHLHRNFMISEFFYDLKHGHISLPKWTDFEPYAKDFLAIYTEYNEFRREIKYDHRASEPDDCFHSMLMCKLAADIHLGKSRRYTQIVSGQ